jgi:gamma-glutamylputrescine oxidase
MCWDSRFNYSYYRPIKGNRLLIGGSGYKTLYSPQINRDPAVIQSIIDELKGRFPIIKNVQFTHHWSGLIDVTRDLTPIADYDAKNHSIQYAMGCAGLPWAAFCGDYLARRIINPKRTEDLSEILGLHRKQFLPIFFQNIFGKRITFALSHLYQLLSH